jgi:hypothetical protein
VNFIESLGLRRMKHQAALFLLQCQTALILLETLSSYAEVQIML